MIIVVELEEMFFHDNIVCFRSQDPKDSGYSDVVRPSGDESSYAGIYIAEQAMQISLVTSKLIYRKPTYGISELLFSRPKEISV